MLFYKFHDVCSLNWYIHRQVLGRRLALVAAVISGFYCSRPLGAQTAWQSNGTALYTSGHVGIGTNTPSDALDVTVSTAGNPTALRVTNSSTASGNTQAAVYVQNGSSYGQLFKTGTGYTSYKTINANDVGFYNSGGNITVLNDSGDIRFASGGSSSVQMIVSTAGNVGIGTTSPSSKLSVNGTITTKEVVVTNTGWADYVFEPGHSPEKLEDVKAYIDEHHHLPGIPSATDVQKTGVGLADMEVKLLAKVEELTLQIIRLNEQNEQLKHRVELLDAK